MLMRSLLRSRFRWPREKVILDWVFPHESAAPEGHAHTLPPLVAMGHADVGRNRWHALVVVRFLQWAATRVPTLEVHIHDETGFLLTPYVVLHDGVAHASPQSFALHVLLLGPTQLRRALRRLDRSLKYPREGIVHVSSPSVHYAEDPVVSELGLSREALASKTLDEVADLVVLPWAADPSSPRP